jgi:hypothetical protein
MQCIKGEFFEGFFGLLGFEWRGAGLRRFFVYGQNGWLTRPYGFG